MIKQHFTNYSILNDNKYGSTFANDNIKMSQNYYDSKHHIRSHSTHLIAFQSISSSVYCESADLPLFTNYLAKIFSVLLNLVGLYIEFCFKISAEEKSNNVT